MDEQHTALLWETRLWVSALMISSAAGHHHLGRGATWRNGKRMISCLLLPAVFPFIITSLFLAWAESHILSAISLSWHWNQPMEQGHYRDNYKSVTGITNNSLAYTCMSLTCCSTSSCKKQLIPIGFSYSAASQFDRGHRCNWQRRSEFSCLRPQGELQRDGERQHGKFAATSGAHGQWCHAVQHTELNSSSLSTQWNFREKTEVQKLPGDAAERKMEHVTERTEPEKKCWAHIFLEERCIFWHCMYLHCY